MYKRFNRHEVFNVEDLVNMKNTINNLIEKDMIFTELDNKVYGLYDGFLYDGLIDELHQVLDADIFCNMVKTINKIIDYIKINGESITLV